MSTKELSSKIKKQPKNEPLFQRLRKELKRIRWTKKEEGMGYLKAVVLWVVVLAALFYVIDLIFNALLGL